MNFNTFELFALKNVHVLSNCVYVRACVCLDSFECGGGVYEEAAADTDVSKSAGHTHTDARSEQRERERERRKKKKLEGDRPTS